MNVWYIYLHVVISSYYGKCRVVRKNFIHGLRNPSKTSGFKIRQSESTTTSRVHFHLRLHTFKKPQKRSHSVENGGKIDGTTTELWMRLKRLLTWIRCYPVCECSPNSLFPNTTSMVYLPTFGYEICLVNVSKYTPY